MAKEFFSDADQAKILAAIQGAERATSGEIKVHIELYCKSEVLYRAEQVFKELNLVATKDRNGVLIYLALEDQKFAALGDQGIHKKVGQEFWDSTRDIMQKNFRQGKFTEGLCEGITMAGNELKKLFPYLDDDSNELDDTISFGGTI